MLVQAVCQAHIEKHCLSNGSLSSELVPLLRSSVFFLPSYCNTKCICMYTLCSSSFRKPLAFVLGLHQLPASSLLTCDQDILNWNRMFSTNSLSLLWTRWHILAKWVWLLECVLGVCAESSPFIPNPMWLLTPRPLGASYFASGPLDLVAILVFFLFHSDFL